MDILVEYEIVVHHAILFAELIPLTMHSIPSIVYFITPIYYMILSCMGDDVNIRVYYNI